MIQVLVQVVHAFFGLITVLILWRLRAAGKEPWRGPEFALRFPATSIINEPPQFGNGFRERVFYAAI